jgi:ribonuclease HI
MRASASFPDTTNNRMEVIACLVGIDKAIKLGARAITVYGDSRYGAQWCVKWHKRRWFLSNATLP